MRSPRRARVVRATFAALLVVAVTPVPAHADRSPAAERRVVELMNAERAAAGVTPLKVADDLREVAYAWSVELAGRFGSGGGTAHNPAYADLVCCWTALGENVGWAARTSDPVAAAETVHRSFLTSSGHRSNLLDPRFTQVGVGVKVHSSGTVYVTVDFRRPSGASASSGPEATSKPASGSAPRSAPAPDTSAPSPAADPAPASTASEDDAAARAAAEAREAEAREAEARRRDERRAELEGRLDEVRQHHARYTARRAAAYEARLAKLTSRRAELTAYGVRAAAVLRTAITVLVGVDSVWEVVHRPVLEARAAG